MRGDWNRLKFRQLCPICGHTGWCMYRGPMENPFAVLCARVSEGCAKHRDGSEVTAKNGQGWIHEMRRDPNRRAAESPGPLVRDGVLINPRMSDMAREFERALRPEALYALAADLGVSSDSLIRLGIGWAENYVDEHGELIEVQAFSFPMRTTGNLIAGIRFRNERAQKWAAKGSINALFIPKKIATTGPLYVVEGPTECAAMMDMGFAVIGRPGNTAGRDFIVDYCKRFIPRRDVIILRNNDPRGSDAERLTLLGAGSLAEILMSEKACASVCIVVPPVKDARDWLQQGATALDVEELTTQLLPHGGRF